MASQPEPTLPIEAHGIVRLESPTGRSFDLVADGAAMNADLPGWSDIRSAIPSTFRARSRSIHALAGILSTTGLTLILNAGGVPVFKIGRGIKPNWLSRLLRLAPAYVSLSALRLLFR